MFWFSSFEFAILCFYLIQMQLQTATDDKGNTKNDTSDITVTEKIGEFNFENVYSTEVNCL